MSEPDSRTSGKCFPREPWVRNVALPRPSPSSCHRTPCSPFTAFYGRYARPPDHHTRSPSHNPAPTSTARFDCRFGVPFRVGTFERRPAPTKITSWANTWPKVRPRTVISDTAFVLSETQCHLCKARPVSLHISALIQILRRAPGNVTHPSSEPPSSFVDSCSQLFLCPIDNRPNRRVIRTVA